MKFNTLKTVECETMPEKSSMKNGVIYLSRKFGLAIHLCACGCLGETVTPIDDGTYGWVMTESGEGLTLRPSIGNQHWPCGSHYWITNGKVEEC